MEFSSFQVAKDPDCPICGDRPSIAELIDYDGFCGLPTQADADAIPSLSAAQLQALRAKGERHLLLDVRDAPELEKARIEGAAWIPLAELSERSDELASWRTGTVVVHCHRGGRSLRACRWLRERGFIDVRNLEGGIDAWSITVDSTVARYG
jgi:adenylyltransferase/sulfurtransferase